MDTLNRYRALREVAGSAGLAYRRMETARHRAATAHLDGQGASGGMRPEELDAATTAATAALDHWLTAERAVTEYVAGLVAEHG